MQMGIGHHLIWGSILLLAAAAAGLAFVAGSGFGSGSGFLAAKAL